MWRGSRPLPRGPRVGKVHPARSVLLPAIDPQRFPLQKLACRLAPPRGVLGGAEPHGGRTVRAVDVSERPRGPSGARANFQGGGNYSLRRCIIPVGFPRSPPSDERKTVTDLS